MTNGARVLGPMPAQAVIDWARSLPLPYTAQVRPARHGGWTWIMESPLGQALAGAHTGGALPRRMPLVTLQVPGTSLHVLAIVLSLVWFGLWIVFAAVAPPSADRAAAGAASAAPRRP